MEVYTCLPELPAFKLANVHKVLPCGLFHGHIRIPLSVEVQIKACAATHAHSNALAQKVTKPGLVKSVVIGSNVLPLHASQYGLKELPFTVFASGC